MTDPTAAFLVIGDEILSGRTQDKNIAALAHLTTQYGIDLKEVRICKDDKRQISRHVQDLKNNHSYLFTSGGIGPTHDDVTAEAIAQALNKPLVPHPETFALLENSYKKQQRPFTVARQKMAHFPKGARPITNTLTLAPGFQIENVYVLAGVPSIFKVMLESCFSTIEKTPPLHSVSFSCRLGEGDLATPLGAFTKKYPDILIGSYPKDLTSDDPMSPHVLIVFRHRDKKRLELVRTHWEQEYHALCKS